jgi:hypothetical protein
MEAYFEEIDYHITKKIKSAETRVLICVAWFTNNTIADELLKKVNTDIEIVVDDNDVNRKSVCLNKLSDNKVSVAYIKDLNKKYYIMHNKFCVIDNHTVITGSYNWTQSAKTHDENISIIQNNKTAAYYSQEFRRIKELNSTEENISFKNEDIQSIIIKIESGLRNLLKEVVPKGLLTSEAVFEYRDNKIENEIRKLDEIVTNNLNKKVGKLNVYFDLICKYGVEFQKVATKDEMIETKDKYFKRNLDKADVIVFKHFQFFKLRAIDQLVNKYADLFKNQNSDEDMYKIMNVIAVLNKTKILISEDLRQW